MGNVPKTTSHALWHNLSHQGENDATIQVLDLARRLKKELDPTKMHNKRKRVERQQTEIERRLEFFRPPPVTITNTVE